jgi:hypothetical protein
VQRSHIIIEWIAAGALLAPGPVLAGLPVRIALNQSVVAHHECITISDLLPPNAPEEIRTRAMALALGEAPLPGGHRMFARVQVEYALREAPELRSAFTIPPAIDVTRWSRPLTREEVLTAITEALRSNQLTVPGPLMPGDLTFSANVAVTEETPRLKVMQIEPSPDGAGTHVRIRTSSEPRAPSFWITLQRHIIDVAGSDVASDEPSLTATWRDFEESPRLQPARRNMQSLRKGQPLGIPLTGHSVVSTSGSPILVRPGQRVQLIVQAQGLRLTVKATSLELGSLGQKVRVRNSDTGKILSGTVVAAQTIEAEF